MAIALLLKDTQYVVTWPPDVSLLKTCTGGGYSHNALFRPLIWMQKCEN